MNYLQQFWAFICDYPEKWMVVVWSLSWFLTGAAVAYLHCVYILRRYLTGIEYQKHKEEIRRWCGVPPGV